MVGNKLSNNNGTAAGVLWPSEYTNTCGNTDTYGRTNTYGNAKTRTDTSKRDTKIWWGIYYWYD